MRSPHLYSQTCQQRKPRVQIFCESICMLKIALRFPLFTSTFQSTIDSSNLHQTKKMAHTVAFYHPFCLSGGGGERVLWCLIEKLIKMTDSDRILNITIYSSTPSPPLAKLSQILLRSFNLTINFTPPTINLAFIAVPEAQVLLSNTSYPRFTMIGQSIGSIKLLNRALATQAKTSVSFPDVYIDTTGAIFTLLAIKFYHRFKLPKHLRKPLLLSAYVHYPTVSTDMLRVQKSPVKFLYYIFFAVLYGIVGSLCHVVMVNSNWTKNHIQSLWIFTRVKPQVLFPPCEVSGFMAAKGKEVKRRDVGLMISIAQFRPEKNHKLQISAFAKLIEKTEGRILTRYPCLTLALIGSCR